MTRTSLLSGMTALALSLSMPALAGETIRVPGPDDPDTPHVMETASGVDEDLRADEIRMMEPVTLQYVVEKGDTLSAIAKETLGDESRWIVIARANDIEDPGKLEIGSRLQIPTRAGDRVAAEATKSPPPVAEKTTAPERKTDETR
jgi:nucleoid-associated protein YgaU